MTYSTPNNFSPTANAENAAPQPSTVEKLKTLKTETTERSQRIIHIFRTAFAETVAEVKDGREIMSPLAQEVTAETVATVKDKSQQAARVVNQTWQQEASTEDLTERLIKFLRAIAQTTKAALFPQVQKQASKLDDILTQRYGSRYENMREKANVARTWYAASEPTTTETKPDASSEQAVVIEVNSQVIS